MVEKGGVGRAYSAMGCGWGAVSIGVGIDVADESVAVVGAAVFCSPSASSVDGKSLCEGGRSGG